MNFDVIELTMDYGKSGRFDAKARRRKEKRFLVLTQESLLYVFAPFCVNEFAPIILQFAVFGLHICGSL